MVSACFDFSEHLSADITHVHVLLLLFEMIITFYILISFILCLMQIVEVKKDCKFNQNVKAKNYWSRVVCLVTNN